MLDIIYLPSFQQDIDSITEYIIYTLEAPKAASNLLDEREERKWKKDHA